MYGYLKWRTTWPRGLVVSAYGYESRKPGSIPGWSPIFSECFFVCVFLHFNVVLLHT